jgi:transposase InsO family protein
MKYEFIAEYAQVHSIELMCKVLKASRSGYYTFAKGTISAREMANDKLLEEIRSVHDESHKIYGSPRIFRDLRENGVSGGRHRIARLMAKAGIVGRIRRRFRITTRKDPKARYAPDQLKRSFVAERPHQIWMSDITYIWTTEGWLYLAVVMDLYSRLIVGWATGDRIDAGLVCRALSSALVRHQPATEIIFHSDRGSQYTSELLRKLMATNQWMALLPSHARSCYDNAVAESFFHTLKTEWVYFEHYKSRQDGHRSLFEYIEMFYNRKRRHSSLDYSTPGQVEASYRTKENA